MELERLVAALAPEAVLGSPDPVEVRDASGAAIAKGLVNYSAADLRRILGRKTEEIEKILGYRSADEIIHRDNLVLLS